MKRLSISLTLLSIVLASYANAGEEIAEVSYRRRPAFLNGEHVVGVWHLKPGDVISTGGGRAYATAKYIDSSRVGLMPNAKAVFQPGWVDLIVGPLDVDVVSGTKHVEQIETPIGPVRIKATTGVINLGEPGDNGYRELSFDVRLGSFELQASRGTDKPPLLTVTADKNDRFTITISENGSAVAAKTIKGEATVRVGAGTTVAFPEKAGGTIVCAADTGKANVTSTKGTLRITDESGQESQVNPGATSTVAYTPISDEQLIASKRGDATAVAAKVATETTPEEERPTYSGKLPQDHPYQRVLRDYLAGLTEADLDPGQKELTVAPPGSDKEELYRTWLLSLDRIPRIGRKRSAPSVSAPARLFLLETIEGEESIMRPPAWPEPLSWFANWDYPGNPYFGSKPLKRRAFATAAVFLMLIDHAQENTPEWGVCRTDWVAHYSVLFSYTYPLVKDVLPPEVQEAYLTGVRKITERMLRWGPKGESIGLDMAAAVGLYYAGEALDDPEIREGAKAYGRRMFTDPEFFNQAGYFVTRGGYDSSYNGQARFYAVWLAMVSDFDFTKDPLRRAYRLRAHLSLPEPDGTINGPTHFNTAASRDAWHDQYEWPFRDYSGAMFTDEAAHLTKLPTDEEIASGGEMRIKEFKTQIGENPGYAKPEELTVYPWSFRPWPNSWSFPQVINYGYDYYRSGSYAHRAQLEADNSPMLKLPLLRDENFVRHFEKEFTVSKNDRFATVIHTGKISAEGPRGVHKYPGPYGFGGGQLSAFWTAKTGSIILGRRAGTSYDRTYDHLDEWRSWPIHAVSGVRHDGNVFTTARIEQPHVEQETDETQGTVRVSAEVPVEMLGQGKVLESPLDYQRTFTIADDGLRVETHLTGADDNKLYELVETIPVYLRDLSYQRKLEPTSIEFLIGKQWTPGSSQYQEDVVAVRLNRFEGSVVITFDRPRRVRLSDADWQDTYMSRAACRNIIVDLLDGNDRGVIFHEASNAYSIAPE